MKSHLNGKLLTAGAAVLFAMSCQSTASVFAAANPVPLEITPICSSADLGVSFWNVHNKNAESTVGTWQNFDANATDTFTAQSGNTLFVTDYNKDSHNNRTEFKSYADRVERNATEYSCDQMDVLPCVNGAIQQNLEVAINGDTATIASLNSVPLCDDVTINFSSYVMPSSYDGQDVAYENGSFGNTTAYPQQIFATKQALLQAGTDGATELQIALPDACNNTQVDVYYGDTISTVGVNGHGTVNILSDLYPSNGVCKSNSVISGVGPVTAPAVTAQTPSVPAPQAELANTGTSPVVPYLTALFLAVGTAISTVAVRRSRI